MGSVRASGSLVRFAIALLEQRFQLGQRIQILRPSRGAFGSDESRQVQTPASAAEDIHVHGVGSEGILVSAAGDLPKQMDVSNGGRQREVESTLDRRLAPVERKPRRSASSPERCARMRSSICE